MSSGKKNSRKGTTKPQALPPAPSPGHGTMENKPGNNGPSEIDFPVVGIGASAGGLAAFEAFFAGMPSDTDPGMAFVLVQHLAPDHKSILTDLIRRYTRMEVFEVEDGMEVKPNCAYIIPPNREMAFLKGKLHLMEPTSPRGQRLPIDFFFRSLAQDQRERAIGLVLSGTGSDGSLGVRAIKAEGGMVMAQNPASAEFEGMPRNALATGLVDFELPPAEMPAQLIAYVTHPGSQPPRTGALTAPKAENALRKIFILLRNQTGHDFSEYKASTIHRRIERRMAVHQVETLDGYVKYVQQTPAEVEALFRDLLIGVTGFFRDPEAFQALEEQVIPRLFSGKPPGSVIRVWSIGCSTGEEAYSLAILLQERLDQLKQNYKVQVFATDIDSQAIATARTGVYPASIATDLKPERLVRYFTAEGDGALFRIYKGIRDLLVFSEQDVLKDPPFSKLDLISCRNLLIYFGSTLQKKLIPMFHYALNPGGFLFLGTSETIGEQHDLFVTLDRKLKLYQRKEDLHPSQTRIASRFLPFRMEGNSGLPPVPGKPSLSGKLSLRELTEQGLLKHLAPVGVLVNTLGDILFLHGRAGQYLEPTPGEAGINNILKMAREGLRGPLTTALHQAVKSREAVRCPNLRVKTNGDFTTVTVTVSPVISGSGIPEVAASPGLAETQLFLVVLEKAAPPEVEPAQPFSPPPGLAGSETDDGRIVALRQELRAKEEYLQSANEELETSNEELRSTNEEMQSVNEELQSTNEELETSKEELQSVNEELATVNAELQTKVADLSRINNDMNNLLAGTNIGTVFVDHHLRVLRFTPAATKIINLIQSDIGRPVGHLVSNLVGYDRIVPDTREVLDTLIPKEVEVQTQTGEWISMRILPYRTLENVIEGAVITFVNISQTKMAQNALQETVSKYHNLIANSPAAIFIQQDNRVVYVNQACLHLFRAKVEPELLGKFTLDLFHPDFQPKTRDIIRRLHSDTKPLGPIEGKIIRLDGSAVEVEVLASPFVYDGAEGIHFFARDISEREAATAALQENDASFRKVADWLPQPVWTCQPDGQCTYLNPYWIECTGVGPSRLTGFGWLDQIHPDDRNLFPTAWKNRGIGSETLKVTFRMLLRDGTDRWFEARTLEMRTPTGSLIHWVGLPIDQIGNPTNLQKEEKPYEKAE